MRPTCCQSGSCRLREPGEFPTGCGLTLANGQIETLALDDAGLVVSQPGAGKRSSSLANWHERPINLTGAFSGTSRAVVVRASKMLPYTTIH